MVEDHVRAWRANVWHRSASMARCGRGECLDDLLNLGRDGIDRELTDAERRAYIVLDVHLPLPGVAGPGDRRLGRAVRHPHRGRADAETGGTWARRCQGAGRRVWTPPPASCSHSAALPTLPGRRNLDTGGADRGHVDAGGSGR